MLLFRSASLSQISFILNNFQLGVTELFYVQKTRLHSDNMDELVNIERQFQVVEPIIIIRNFSIFGSLNYTGFLLTEKSLKNGLLIFWNTFS
jgi:hypothetical protein